MINWLIIGSQFSERSRDVARHVFTQSRRDVTYRVIAGLTVTYRVIAGLTRNPQRSGDAGIRRHDGAVAAQSEFGGICNAAVRYLEKRHYTCALHLLRTSYVVQVCPLGTKCEANAAQRGQHFVHEIIINK